MQNFKLFSFQISFFLNLTLSNIEVLHDTSFSSNLNSDFFSGLVEQEVIVAIEVVNQTH